MFFYDLILQHEGELQTETLHMVDAAQAWRLGPERYPHCIRGVVRREGECDGSAAEATQTPLIEGHPKGLGWRCCSSRAR